MLQTSSFVKNATFGVIFVFQNCQFQSYQMNKAIGIADLERFGAILMKLIFLGLNGSKPSKRKLFYQNTASNSKISFTVF